MTMKKATAPAFTFKLDRILQLPTWTGQMSSGGKTDNQTRLTTANQRTFPVTAAPIIAVHEVQLEDRLSDRVFPATNKQLTFDRKRLTLGPAGQSASSEGGVFAVILPRDPP
ncbi:hypothetical protein AMECASPLE_030374 [Ameca splendens]|uniref:Uncharacterized protein n=1 Tax=Ameca splendens TaxID=208324 RepID=A0ABV0XVA8_9TELE